MSYPESVDESPASAPRTTRRRVATRQRLLEAALHLVSEKPLPSVTIEAVCERAGYTRGAFYSNFTSMEGLLVALFEDRSEAVLPTLRDNLSATPLLGSTTVEAYLHEAITRLLRALPTERLWHLLLTDVASQALRSPQAAAVLSAHRAAMHQQLTTSISSTLQQLGRRPLTSPEDLTSALLASYEGGTAQLHLDAQAPSEESRVRALTALVLGLTEPVADRAVPRVVRRAGGSRSTAGRAQ